MPDSITLTFDPKVLDYLYNVLGQRPWAEANPLMVDIGRQVAQQQQSPLTGSAVASNGSAGPIASAH